MVRIETPPWRAGVSALQTGTEVPSQISEEVPPHTSSCAGVANLGGCEVFGLESPRLAGVSAPHGTRRFRPKIPVNFRLMPVRNPCKTQVEWPESPPWYHPGDRRIRPRQACNRRVFDSSSPNHCWQPTQNLKTYHSSPRNYSTGLLALRGC